MSAGASAAVELRVFEASWISAALRGPLVGYRMADEEPVVAGAVFDAQRSYQPVIWGCLALSALATAATWRLIGPPAVARPSATAAR